MNIEHINQLPYFFDINEVANYVHAGSVTTEYIESKDGDKKYALIG